MVGLSIVLESHKAAHRKTTQVFNKSSIIVANGKTTAKHLISSSPASGFLELCFFCGQKLISGMDIYMYKGDRVFCSVKCRDKHMDMDEQESAATCTVKKKKKHQYCSFSASTAAGGGGGSGSGSASSSPIRLMTGC